MRDKAENGSDIRSDIREKNEENDNLDISADIQKNSENGKPDNGSDNRADNESDIQPDNRDYSCKICGKAFSSRNSIRMHSMRAHRSKTAWRTGKREKKGKKETDKSKEEKERSASPSKKRIEEKGGRGRRRKHYSNVEIRKLYQVLNDNLDRSKAVERICNHFDRKNRAPSTSELTEIILELPSGVKNRRIARMIAEEYEEELEFSKLDRRDFSRRREASRRPVSQNRGNNEIIQALKVFQQMQNLNKGNNEEVERLEEKLNEERRRRMEEREKRHQEELKRLEDKIETSRKVGMSQEDLYAKLSDDFKEISAAVLADRRRYLRGGEEIPEREDRLFERSSNEIIERLPSKCISE